MYELTPSGLSPSPVERRDVESLRGYPAIEEDRVSLRDYWLVLRKRMWLIALCCFGTVFATTLFLLTTTPIYTAETTLLIERNAPHVIEIKEALSEPLGSDEYDFYKTQYEILKSRTLASCPGLHAAMCTRNWRGNAHLRRWIGWAARLA